MNNTGAAPDRRAKAAAQRRTGHVVVGSKSGTLPAAGRHYIQNVNSLHAHDATFIKPFCGPAAKKLNGDIRWLEVRLAGRTRAERIRAS